MSQSTTLSLGAMAARRASPATGWWRSRWMVPMPGFVLLLLLSFPPFVYAVYLSLVNVDVAVPNRAISFVGLDNYIQVLGSADGQSALAVTLLVSFGSTLAAVVIGLVMAYLIHLFAGKLSGVVTVLVLIPLAVSPVAMALVFSLMLDPLYGPVPQVIQLITGNLIAMTATPASALATIIFVQTWQWSPLAVILLLGGLKSLPVEPTEAALIDGASFWQTVWHIHLPLLRPLLAVAAIFEFILCSQVFAATELLTNGGPGNATVDLSLFIYKIGISESSQVSVAAAAGVITLVLGLISTAVWLKVSRWDTQVYR